MVLPDIVFIDTSIFREENFFASTLNEFLENVTADDEAKDLLEIILRLNQEVKERAWCLRFLGRKGEMPRGYGLNIKFLRSLPALSCF